MPFFVVDRKPGASGAQPAPVLLDLLRQAWPAEPAAQVVAEGVTADPTAADLDQP